MASSKGKTAFHSPKELLRRYNKAYDRLFCGAYDKYYDYPLSRWIKKEYRSIPPFLTLKSLREILSKHPTKWLPLGKGVTKAHYDLCTVLERICREASIDECKQALVQKKARITITGRALGITSIDDYSEEDLGSLWDQSCQKILDYGFGQECIGRFAKSLEDIPVNLWEKPLADYVRFSYQELIDEPGYGPKKVKAILGVFAIIHDILCNMQCPNHLNVDIYPKLFLDIERWVCTTLRSRHFPKREEIVKCFVEPLIRQIAQDGGPELAEIVRRRLGIRTKPQKLGEIASHLKKNRVRIRQLLVRIALILKVRWREGQYIIDDLCEWMNMSDNSEYEKALVNVAYEIFYPVRKAAKLSSFRQLYTEFHLSQDDQTEVAVEYSSGRAHLASRETSRTPKFAANLAAARGTEYIHDAIQQLLDDV